LKNFSPFNIFEQLALALKIFKPGTAALPDPPPRTPMILPDIQQANRIVIIFDKSNQEDKRKRKTPKQLSAKWPTPNSSHQKK